MSTPFKQMPGRGNYAKTGNGIPSALMQKNTRTGEGYSNVSANTAATISDEVKLNKDRLMAEGMAKSDSIVGANARKVLGGTKFQQGMAGNKAANATRSKAGFSDMQVLRGKKVESGSPTSEGSTSYTRKNPVEKDFSTKKYNTKTKLY